MLDNVQPQQPVPLSTAPVN